jgi:hypothetical protein
MYHFVTGIEVAAGTEGEATGEAAIVAAATGAAATEHDPQEQQAQEEQPWEQPQRSIIHMSRNHRRSSSHGSSRNGA